MSRLILPYCSGRKEYDVIDDNGEMILKPDGSLDAVTSPLPGEQVDRITAADAIARNLTGKPVYDKIPENAY